MAILVTGGAGYVGSHVVLELIKSNQKTIVLDNLITGHANSIIDTKLIIGNINDKALLDDIFKNEKIEIVVHFAGYSIVSESISNPQKYFENNVSGTKVLLETMIKNNIRNIVFASSSSVYGNNKEEYLSEDVPTDPLNPYAKSKVMVEEMLKNYSDKYDLNYIILRFFNVCGADKSGKIGELHSPETHLIPVILKKMLNKKRGIDENFSINGNQHNTKDGTCIRDYVHVSDVAKAVILASDKLKQNSKKNCYNVGTGIGTSVFEILEKCAKITGVELKYDIKSKRENESSSLISNIKKIKKNLDWHPEYLNIEKIIVTAWNWHKKFI